MHVFTYGSLMFAQVWQRVVRGTHSTRGTRDTRGMFGSEPATLDAYARYAIVGETYPAMVPEYGGHVTGVLYRDLTASDVAALDAFEGSEYRRDNVRVRLASGGEVNAGAYIYLLPHKLSGMPWLPEQFRMERFLDEYCSDKLKEG